MNMIRLTQLANNMVCDSTRVNVPEPNYVTISGTSNVISFQFSDHEAADAMWVFAFDMRYQPTKVKSWNLAATESTPAKCFHEFDFAYGSASFHIYATQLIQPDA